MFCPRCGTVTDSEHKFCKNCGAPVGAAGSAQAGTAAAQAAPAVPPQAAVPGAYPGVYQGASAPPPGTVPVMYQAYPGGPQQVYYMPAQGAQGQGAGGLLEGLRAQIRHLASTDKLEGFSLSQTFSQAFSRHSMEDIEEHLLVGTSRTTPPLEMVQTGWPKPWMFIRLLAVFVVAAVALYVVWDLLAQPGTIAGMLIWGTFAVPLAVVLFIFEMNTPKNVSIALVGELFVIGGALGLCVALFEYQISFIANIPGIVEETAKLTAVLLVVRSARYKYELNGILLGCAVGAGFACFESLTYALGFLGGGGFLQPTTIVAWAKALIEQAQAGNNQQLLLQASKDLQAAMSAGVNGMLSILVLRGVESPFLHVVWTSISAGAFWRVKQDKPTSISMLADTSFLKAFAIPVVLHTLWDLPVTFPSLTPQTEAELWAYYGLQALTGLVSWFVLFGMIQQGLHQVRNLQRAQLEHTVAHVEQTLGLGARRFELQPQQSPAGT